MRSVAAFLGVTVLLGVNFVAVRFSNAEVPPFLGAASRFAVAAALLTVIALVLRAPFPRGRALAYAVGYGVTAFGATYALVYWGLLGVTSGVTAVLFATVPLTTVLMAAGLAMERVTWRAVAGAVVAVAGIAIISAERLGGAMSPAHFAAVIGAAVAAAAAGIIVKRGPRTHPASMNAVAMAVGAAALAAASAVAQEKPAVPQLAATWVALGWLVLSTTTAFLLFVWLLARWPASRVAYTTVLSPLVTVAVAAALAGEAVTPLLVLGGAVTLLGVWAGALAKPARAPASAAAPGTRS